MLRLPLGKRRVVGGQLGRHGELSGVLLGSDQELTRDQRAAQTVEHIVAGGTGPGITAHPDDGFI
jgi:hypothetical protein